MNKWNEENKENKLACIIRCFDISFLRRYWSSSFPDSSKIKIENEELFEKDGKIFPFKIRFNNQFRR